MAELWVVHDSLLYAWCFDYNCVLLESDYKIVIEILQGTSDAFQCCSLISTSEELLSRKWMINYRHVVRECNCVTDRLAVMSRHSSIGVVEWSSAPHSLVNLVFKEAHED
ncbi:hypothetical protein V6N13_018825 [Hibiscus sabdariffa]